MWEKEQAGNTEKRGVEEINSLVSVLFSVEELLFQFQLLPNRFTQDTKFPFRSDCIHVCVCMCVLVWIDTFFCTGHEFISVQYVRAWPCVYVAFVYVYVYEQWRYSHLLVCQCDDSIWTTNTGIEQSAREHKEIWKNKSREKVNTITLQIPPLFHANISSLFNIDTHRPSVCLHATASN